MIIDDSNSTAAGARLLQDLNQEKLMAMVESKRVSRMAQINRGSVAARIMAASPFRDYSHKQLTDYGVPRRKNTQREKGKPFRAGGSKLGLRRRRELAMVKKLGEIFSAGYKEMLASVRRYSWSGRAPLSRRQDVYYPFE